MQSERAYDGRTASGEWGLALGDRAQTMMLDVVGLSFIPLYRFFGPISMLLLLVVFIVSMVRIVVTVMVREIIFTRTQGCGPWIFASTWGTLYSLALSPIRWADEATRRIAEDVEQKMVNMRTTLLETCTPSGRCPWDHKGTMMLRSQGTLATWGS